MKLTARGFELKTETSFFFKRGQSRVFTQKKVKKNYETSKKCDRVAQKSEITEK